MKDSLQNIDRAIISIIRRIRHPLARFSLFVVFFWFGILKVLGTSPANPLVAELLAMTMPSFPFETFIILWGLYEMAIGVIFAIPRLERLAIPMLLFHMITTAMPLVILKGVVWQGFLVPTLEGQYIIKNLVVVALAIEIAASLKPLYLKKRPM